MDWRYVWAYHRIADRTGDRGRRAEDVSAQLAQLAQQTPEGTQRWKEREPRRGRMEQRAKGLWEGSAWGTYSAWEAAGIKQPRNFFSPEKNFVKKLRALANSGTLTALQSSFRDEFVRDEDDLAALERLGWSLDGLTYQGIVTVAWGVPKGIAWIGVTDDVDTWSMLPEERANALLHPIRRFAPRPATILLATPPSTRPWLVRPVTPEWSRCVAQNLLGTTARELHPETVLTLPRSEDIAAARLRQLRGRSGPFVVIDENTVRDTARFFPWLWNLRDAGQPRIALRNISDPLAKPPHGLGSWIDPLATVQLDDGEDYDAFLRAVVVKSIVTDRLQLFLRHDPAVACYRAVFGEDCKYFESRDGMQKVTPPHIDPFVLRYHPELTRILYTVTEWAREQNNVDSNRYLDWVWRDDANPHSITGL